MSKLLIILPAYGLYLVVVGITVTCSWYAEKMDPENDLPDSIWDEILPNRTPAEQPSDHKARGLFAWIGKHFHH